MLLLYFLLISFLQETPFKPREEFEIKLDYQFKQRPPVDQTSVQLDFEAEAHKNRNASAILPYLTLNINILKNSTAAKVVIKNNLNQSVVNKKLKTEPTIIALVVGYTDDVKDRVSPHEYTLVFLSADKKPLSKIVIFVDEDGTFIVNGEKRGRF